MFLKDALGTSLGRYPVRIFFDHQAFSLQDGGGAARYHFELLRQLSNYAEVKSEILLGLSNTIYPFASLNGPRLRVTTAASSLPPGAKRYTVNEAISSLAVLSRGTYDIYHPTLCRAIPFVRRRRVVVTHHDCAHETYPHLFRNSGLILRNKRKLYQTADAILCVSASSRDDLLRYYEIDPKRTFVVHHGISLPKDESPIPWGALPKRPYLLFVGFRETYKNFSMLLSAYATSGLASEFDLLAVGGNEFSETEKSEFLRLNVNNSVKHFFRISDGELSKLYRWATLFVYPSLYQGFGFPPLEAMSVGCPVLASNSSCLPEICGEGAFYFDPSDPGSLQRSLLELLSSPTLLRSKITSGYNQVKQYSWSKTAEETYRIYSKILDG